MKTHNKLIAGVLIALFFMLSSSCERDNETQMGRVTFSASKLMPLLKSAEIDIDDAKAVIISIEGVDGSTTDYLSSEINLYKVDGEYISQALVLPVGSYHVSEFFLIDEGNEVIYAVPAEDSPLAANVSDPLPIPFNVVNDRVKTTTVEVISTESLDPADFGFHSFEIFESETFNFLISVLKAGTTEFLAANLSVTRNNYSLTQELDSAASNVIQVKDGYNQYELTVEKEGYEPFSQTISNAALRSYVSLPLVVELVPVDGITLTDIDGNVYAAVQIGEQVWMAENLRTTHYADGSPIPLVEDAGEWSTLSADAQAYCWYDNDPDLGEEYGALYTWNAAMKGNSQSSPGPQGVCPDGWHLPSDAEWMQLEMSLGMSQETASIFGPRGDDEGGKMKEAGTAHWASPNTGGTNEVGFTALPAGQRDRSGDYILMGEQTFIWASNGRVSGLYFFRRLFYDRASINKGDYYAYGGFSVRCVQD